MHIVDSVLKFRCCVLVSAAATFRDLMVWWWKTLLFLSFLSLFSPLLFLSLFLSFQCINFFLLKYISIHHILDWKAWIQCSFTSAEAYNGHFSVASAHQHNQSPFICSILLFLAMKGFLASSMLWHELVHQPVAAYSFSNVVFCMASTISSFFYLLNIFHCFYWL